MVSSRGIVRLAVETDVMGVMHVEVASVAAVTDRSKCAIVRFGAVQAVLGPLEGMRLTGERRCELWRLVWEPAWQTGGALSWQEAKELQLEATAGRPLTVCIGNFWRPTEVVEVVPGRSTGPEISFAYGDGCGLVYPDSTSTRGRTPFRIYCPACSRGHSRRRAEAQSLATAYARGREQIVVGYNANGSEILAWWGHCSVCSEPFAHLRRHTSRCDSCRRQHRTAS
jgi:hypothetical protein